MNLRSNLRSVAATALVACALGFSTAARADSFKVAYIDIAQAVSMAEEWQQAYKDLKSDFDKKQAQLDQKTEAIKRSAEELESPVLKDDAKAARRRQLDQEMMGLRDLYMKLQNDISERENAYRNEIGSKMNDIIDELRIKGGYAAIFDRRMVLSAPRSDDLTEELIKRYNVKFPAKKGGGVAPKADPKKK
jgi:outer membrane protein